MAPVVHQPRRLPAVRSLALVASAMLVAFGSAISLQARQWYFVVANKSSSRLIRLEAREAGGTWGTFDIGSGIKPGETVRINWDRSTNNQDCNQYLRAKFSDGAWSDEMKFNFCEDLDEPIEYTD